MEKLSMGSSYEGSSHSRHSCDYCQRIVVEPPLAVFTDANAFMPFNSFVNGFEFSLRETVEASENSCVLFQRVVRDLDHDSFHENPSDVQSHIDHNPARRILLYFQIEPRTMDIEDIDPSYPSYSCFVSWVREWADEAKERPDWFGGDRSIMYELCSEPGIF
jgi:hypothetical protein